MGTVVGRISTREETGVAPEPMLRPLMLQVPQRVGFGRRREPRRHSFQQPRKQELPVLEQELVRRERVLVEERRRRAAVQVQAQVAK